MEGVPNGVIHYRYLKIIFDERLPSNFWHLTQKEFKDLSDIALIEPFHFYLLMHADKISQHLHL